MRSINHGTLAETFRNLNPLILKIHTYIFVYSTCFTFITHTHISCFSSGRLSRAETCHKNAKSSSCVTPVTNAYHKNVKMFSGASFFTDPRLCDYSAGFCVSSLSFHCHSLHNPNPSVSTCNISTSPPINFPTSCNRKSAKISHKETCNHPFCGRCALRLALFPIASIISSRKIVFPPRRVEKKMYIRTSRRVCNVKTESENRNYDFHLSPSKLLISRANSEYFRGYNANFSGDYVIHHAIYGKFSRVRVSDVPRCELADTSSLLH